MIINPAKIEFESRDDIIDYISKGLPPSRKNFYEVMDKVEYPNSSSTYARLAPRAGEEVIIVERLIPEDERRTYEYILSRVYHNRVVRRNKRIAAYIAIGALALIFGGKHKSHDDVDDPDCDSFAAPDDIIIEDF